MPNIFQRIFRRKSSKNPEDLIGPSVSSKKIKLSKRQKKKLKKQGSGSYPSTHASYHTGSSIQKNKHQAPHSLPEEVIRKPSFNTDTPPLSSDSGGHVSNSYSGSSTEHHIKINHTNSGGSRNDSRSGGTSQSHSHEDDSDSRSESSGPVNDENHFVADFSGFAGDHINRKAQTTSRLDYDHVQTFEKHMETVPIKPLYPNQSNKRQLTRLPDGQLVAINSLAGGVPSPMSASSEFDLSTDAEDNEYNQIRRTATNNLTPMLEHHSSTSSDEDESVGLNTIIKTESIRRNTSYLSNSESDTEGPEGDVHGTGDYYVSDDDNDPDSVKLVPHGNNTKESLNHKSSHSGSTAPSEAENDETNTFQFEQKFDETLAATVKKKKAIDRDLLQSPSSETTSSGGSAEKSLSTTLSPRTIAIQQAQNMRKQGKLGTELYPDSTDSELDDKKTQQQKDLLPPRSKSTEDSSSLDNGNSKRTKNRNDVIENFADFGNSNFLTEVGSKSVADPTSPVSELLRQAKDRRNRRKEASSVNSAPVSNLGYSHSKRDKGRKFKGGQSPARSRDDASASASSAAKEKLRRRRYEKEAYLKSLNNDSDEGSDKGADANESWLIDEVTGALGPRGIAADLESLGERSGLSKASHRSHGKKRSRRSKRSDESIGSRHSRHSRSSRYSVKSSKSQASLVSENSRSVANDLLRLEMQLARVGSRNDSKIEGNSMGDGGNATKPHSSRKSSSRSKNTITKRVKLTVVAPAGKLGIILANKTDAKGTVVSGVRTTSALADRVSPGDRIIEIDGEDVSRMTVSEITSIMARKNDFERILTVLTTARDAEINSTAQVQSGMGHDGRW